MKKLINLSMVVILGATLGLATSSLVACGGPQVRPAEPDGRPAMRERYKEEHRDLDRVMREERDER